MALHESGVIALSTVLGAVFMLMVVLIYRRCRDEAHTYTRVAHGLDDEERQFKKVLEMQVSSCSLPRLLKGEKKQNEVRRT
jgi:hypothetical protein